MKISKLLDMPLREVLENYCVLFSPECAYIYGVTTQDLAERMYKEYNVDEDYPEAMCPEELLNIEVWDHEELIDWEKIEKIMDNLGISKKENTK